MFPRQPSMTKVGKTKWKKNSLIKLAATKMRDDYESSINYLSTLVENINNKNKSNKDVAVLKNTRQERMSCRFLSLVLVFQIIILLLLPKMTQY